MDPINLDDYNRQTQANLLITGDGPDRVTTFPCPGCAAIGWKSFTATQGFESCNEPATCDSCGRTFRFAIIKEHGAVKGSIILVSGDPMPDYLPSTIPFL